MPVTHGVTGSSPVRTASSHFGSLAQLNRASDYGSEGYRFESYRSHTRKDSRQAIFFSFYPYSGRPSTARRSPKEVRDRVTSQPLTDYHKKLSKLKDGTPKSKKYGFSGENAPSFSRESTTLRNETSIRIQIKPSDSPGKSPNYTAMPPQECRTRGQSFISEKPSETIELQRREPAAALPTPPNNNHSAADKPQGHTFSLPLQFH